MDGLWTWYDPDRKSSGVLVIRDSKVVGGDDCYLCTGTVNLQGDTMNIALTFELHNSLGTFGGAWGDNAPRFDVVFEGPKNGDVVNGRARRIDMIPEAEIVMTRHGDLP